MQTGREIKFRYVFKHPKTKEVQTAIITIDDMERNDWSKTFKWDSLRFELVARQRYTGLHDKNGKEIYEGDILKNDLSIGEVKWVQEHCAFVIRELDPHVYHLMQYDGKMISTEVIGNIYENPELLEVTSIA